MKKGFAFLPVLIILAVFGVAGFATFIIAKSKANVVSKPQEQKDVVSKEKNNKTKNWKEYTNPVYSYSITYNSEFSPPAADSSPSPPPPTGLYLGKKWGNPQDFNNFEWCDFEVMGVKETNGFEGEISSMRNSGDYEEKEVKIGDTLAKKFVYSKKGDAVSESYYFSNGPFVYRVGFNYKKGGAHAEFCKENWTQTIMEFKFLDLPDFFEEGNLTSGENGNFVFVYDKPGNPAAMDKLIFTQNSMCNNMGSGYEVCAKGNLKAGDRLEVWGKEKSDGIEVLWLTEIAY